MFFSQAVNAIVNFFKSEPPVDISNSQNKSLILDGKEYIPIRAGLLNHYRKLSDKIRINWHYTYECNFNCDYCFSKNKRNKHIAHPKEKLLDAANKITKIGDNIEVMLIGLEPTTNPAFLDIVNVMTNNMSQKSSILCMTNFSKPAEYFDEIYKINPNVMFELSIHFQYTIVDKIYEKIMFMLERFPHVSVALMFHPEHKTKVKKLYEMLLPLIPEYPNLKLAVAPVRGRESNFQKFDVRYQDGDIQWAHNTKSEINQLRNDASHAAKAQDAIASESDSSQKKDDENNFFIDFLGPDKRFYRYVGHFRDAMLLDLLHFKGFYCFNGRRWIIGIEGNINTIPCAMNDKSLERYNIFSDDITKLKKMTDVYVCKNESCLCGPQTNFPKYLDIKYAPEYAGGKHKYSIDTLDVKKLNL